MGRNESKNGRNKEERGRRMNKEIEKYINEKVEEFRKQLIEEAEKMEEQKEDVFPKVGDTYWFIESMGIVNNAIWSDSVVDKGNLALNNVFKTKEEAKFAFEKLKVIAELKKFEEPKDREWGNDNKHYFILYDHLKNIIDVTYNYCYSDFNIYFETKEKAREAIEAVGEERIKKYYLEVEE